MADSSGNRITGFAGKLGTSPQAASSGSVFEVSGFSPAFTAKEIENTLKQEKTLKEKLLILGMALLAIGAAVGAFFLFPGGGWYIVAKLTAKIIVVNVLKYIGVIAALGLYGFAMVNMFIVGKRVNTISTSEVFLENIYFSTKEQNLGLLSSSHTSDIYYKDGVFKSKEEVGNYIVADNGEMYFYYSTIRPTDYFANYWLIFASEHYTGNAENAKLFKEASEVSESQIVTDDATGTRYYCEHHASHADSSNPSKLTENCDKQYIIVEKYVFEDGIYYYYPLSVDVGYRRSSNLSLSSIQSQLSSVPYIMQGDNIYIAGEYNAAEINTPYKMAGVPGNNLEFKDNKYYLNGYEITEGYSTTATQRFAYYNGPIDTGWKKGYDYFEKVYYTQRGNENFFPVQSGDNPVPVKDNIRYATYEYIPEAEDVTNLKEGYDYITQEFKLFVQNNYGEYYKHTDNKFYEIQDNTYYVVDGAEVFDISNVAKRYSIKLEGSANFKLTSISKTQATDTTNAFVGGHDYIDGVDASLTGKIIEVPVYPGAFICPYSASNSSLDNISETGNFVNVLKGGAGKEVQTIAESITYFYYDAGYITDLSLELVTSNNYDSDNDGTKDSKVATQVYTFICDSDYKNAKDVDISETSIAIYRVNGSEVKVESKTLKQIYEGLGGTDFNNCYLMDVTGYTDKLDSFSGSLVKNMYIKHNGNLYKLNEGYVIGGTIDNTDGGFVYQVYSKHAVKTEYSFMYNKFLTDSDWGLYTQHKFTQAGKTMDFKDFGFKDNLGSDYWLIPQGVNDRQYYSGYSNPHIITNLAENCKVTLGGGLRLDHLGSDKSTNSGIITIK